MTPPVNPDTRRDSATLRTLYVHSLTDQVFTHENEQGWQFHWNVSEGRRLADERDAEVFAFVPALYGITEAHIRERYPDIDEAHARTRDLSQPLLFLPFEDGHLLVDGWHRLLKAVLEGVSDLPAYVLTQEEADRCLLITLPPGRGISFGR